MAKVFIEPVGVTIEVAEHETLMEALTRAAVDVPTSCAGRGTCGKCLVRLGAGELSAPTDVERRRLSAGSRAEGWRLACQAHPRSARVSIEVRETGGKRRILTASRLHHGAAHPAVTKERLRLRAADLHDTRGDLERVRDVVPRAEVPLAVLSGLPDVLRAGGWRLSVTRHGNRIIDIEGPDAAPDAYGVAVDIGTSKIITYLFDLRRGTLVDQEAVENPQMRFGEEVISRIARAADARSLRELAAAAADGVNADLQALVERQGIHARHIYDVTVVGNTAMHHLALGVSPVGLGAAPFAPAVDEPVVVRAAELGLNVNPEAGVCFLPPIAGFVGSDALAVIAATRLAGKRRPSMAIDIGTNTEIALAHDGRVTVTSCASGPAFEGYQIEHGMKAVAGAIEKVRLDGAGEPVEIVTIAGAEPLGLCGSGVVDVLAGLVRCGVVDAGGRMQPHPRVRRGAEGLEYLLTAGPTGDIAFTQHDVRNLQLAKAAITSGWTLLLERLGVDVEHLGRVYIAGAFGNYLDLHAAQSLGLFPPVPRERVAFVGNAAGVGAQMALIDVRARRRMARLRERVEFLDLATNAAFQEVFTGHLGFAPAD